MSKIYSWNGKVLIIFSLSVYMTMGCVLLITTTEFSCAGNGPYQIVCNETHTHISHCHTVSTILGWVC